MGLSNITLDQGSGFWIRLDSDLCLNPDLDQNP
jgi:hypothetical protein